MELAKEKWALNPAQLKLGCSSAASENPREHKTLLPLYYKALNFFSLPLWCLMFLQLIQSVFLTAREEKEGMGIEHKAN